MRAMKMTARIRFYDMYVKSAACFSFSSLWSRHFFCASNNLELRKRPTNVKTLGVLIQTLNRIDNLILAKDDNLFYKKNNY